MFHCVLRISLCSPEPLLEATFKALQADADFRHKITFSAEAQSLSATNRAREDIFFMDSTHIAVLPDLRKTAKPAARIVLIDTAGHEAALQESLVSLLDGIWPLSANPDIVARRINGLLRDALLCKEYALLQHCLETTIDTTPDLVWFKDIQGKHLKVNQAFCHFVGKSKEDIIGRGHYYIWDIEPDEYAKSEYVCLETEEEVIARGATCIFDESVKTKLGMRQFKTRKSPIFDEHGVIIGTVGIAYDMTDITKSSAEVEIILQNLPFAAMILDEENRIANANQKFLDFFRFKSMKEVIGSYRSKVRAIAIKDHQLKQVGDHLEIHSWKKGEEIILESYEKEILDTFQNRIGKLVIYRDVTSERRAKQMLERSANTDELTGLYNRRYFYSQLPETVPAGAALLFVDLDDFKKVNDTFGHRAGDDALRLTAQLLKKHFNEALTSRIGGDEFVLYLAKAHSVEQVVSRACRLQKAMKSFFTKDTPWQGLSASIGVVVTDTDDIGRDELVRCGDIAMYEAKRRGKNRVCHYHHKMKAPHDEALSPLCVSPCAPCHQREVCQAKKQAAQMRK